MYVIATVFCSNFHFSVSLHVPFSQFLFERDSYSNEYLLANFGVDTAENGPLKVCQKRNARGASLLFSFFFLGFLFFWTKDSRENEEKCE